MASYASLPPEILRMIFEHLASWYRRGQRDISLFQAMRVCRVFRDHAVVAFYGGRNSILRGLNWQAAIENMLISERFASAD